MVAGCADIARITVVKSPRVRVCETCVQTGDPSVHLRTCQTCGATLCCDSSPNKHASKHARSSNHPVIASAEQGRTLALLLHRRRLCRGPERAPLCSVRFRRPSLSRSESSLAARQQLTLALQSIVAKKPLPSESRGSSTTRVKPVTQALPVTSGRTACWCPTLICDRTLPVNTPPFTLSDRKRSFSFNSPRGAARPCAHTFRSRTGNDRIARSRRSRYCDVFSLRAASSLRRRFPRRSIRCGGGAMPLSTTICRRACSKIFRPISITFRSGVRRRSIPTARSGPRRTSSLHTPRRS